MPRRDCKGLFLEDVKEDLQLKELYEAGKDFLFLLDRGYPRKGSLELVGSRYQLDRLHRDLLHRGVFSKRESTLRKEKLLPIERIRGANVALDGYNVIITLESALKGLSLIHANDGVIRDIAGVSSRYKISKTTEGALGLIFNLLHNLEPIYTLILLDSPISLSGVFATNLREIMKERQINGDALAVKVPERYLKDFDGIVATSDSALINQSRQVVDMAGYIIKEIIKCESLISFKNLL